MYYRYQPYPYYRRYYNIDPYYYRRYYIPYNIYDSQISDVNQNITNFGDMTDVIQNVDVFQSMAEPVGMCTSPMESPQGIEYIGVSTVGICTLITVPAQESFPEDSGTSSVVPTQESFPEDSGTSSAVPFPL